MAKDEAKWGILGEAYQGMADERSVAQRVLQTRRAQAQEASIIIAHGGRTAQTGE